MKLTKEFKWKIYEMMRLLPDKQYLCLYYFVMTGQILHMNHPVTFNEKLQWLKLHDRNPLYTKLVDKYEVRNYVKGKIGEENLIPLIGIWDRVDDIKFSELPAQFVLKCTHDSGSVMICSDKNAFDMEAAKRNLELSIGRNMYIKGREWPYKDVKPRIIGEELLLDGANKELRDYKIFCFDGEPKIIQVDFDRFTYHKRNMYTIEWEYIPLEICYPTFPDVKIERPEALGEMLEKARILASGLTFARIDFYITPKKLYFGEITLFHGSGIEPFRPNEWNVTLGNYIHLPSENSQNMRKAKCLKSVDPMNCHILEEGICVGANS